MTDELNLVHDLAVILISAGVLTTISKALKQPLVLGYIIAGFLVGPHVNFFPGISSTEAVNQWSEIGIIFLLFAVGLEFSFKRVLKVGSTAIMMAASQFFGMMAVGILLGQAIGFSTMESIFLGGMISVSSTAIVVKAYDDLGLKDESYAPGVFGALVVQDIISVVMMVLLPALAISHGFSGTVAITGILKLGFFLVLWFLVGIYVIPSLFRWAHEYLNDEILLIISIGLCFAMVALASYVGFSAALGAFVMGSILSETVENERILKLVSGMKTLFGAVFFVSVGMMLDPAVILEHWLVIIVLSLAVLAGSSFFAASGALLAGNGIDRSVKCGFSVAQVGEFAFILATLGISLGVVREYIYPVIISVSVITVFATPYMIKYSDAYAARIRKKVPQKIIDRLDSRAESMNAMEGESSGWKDYLKSQAIRVSLYGVLVIAVVIGAGRFIPKSFSPLLNAAITLAFMLPFLVVMVSENSSLNSKARVLLRSSHSNVWLLLSVGLVKLSVAVLAIYTVIASHFNMSPLTSFVVLAVSVVVFFLFIRSSYHYFIRLEKRFLENYNRKDELERQKTPVRASLNEKMSAYDVRLAAADVTSDYALIGKPLSQQPFRDITGVNIVKITRGSHDIFIPSGDEPVYPGDVLVAVGTKSQTDAFSKYMAKENATSEDVAHKDFQLESMNVERTSPLVGKTLRELRLRSYGCMVVSIVSDEGVFTNPSADFIFRPGDLVWVGGQASAVKTFIKVCGK